MLMILLSSLSVIRHLICGHIKIGLLNLKLINQTLQTEAGSGLLISMLEKFNLICLAGLITLLLLMWKWMALFLQKNHLLRCWCCVSLLNWIGALALFLLLKVPPRKLKPWFFLWSLFFPKDACYLYKCTIWPCMECCYVLAGPSVCCLEMLDKQQKQVYRKYIAKAYSKSRYILAAFIEPMGHHWVVAEVLAELFAFSYSFRRSTHYSDRLYDFSVTIPRCYKDL